MQRRDRQGRMRRVSRLAGSILPLAVAVLTASVPVQQAAACSCAFSTHVEAIATADAAFIGTVVATGEPPLFSDDPIASAPHAFEVTRSKQRLHTPFELEVAAGPGASCGLDMSVGEEWVVIAHSWEGRLQTNLCSGSVLTNSLAPNELARIEDALPHDDPAAAFEDESVIPMPMIVAAVAALGIGLVSLVAFRRARPG
jgi:hypothetical protein